jgi:hypothetical protein
MRPRQPRNRGCFHIDSCGMVRGEQPRLLAYARNRIRRDQHLSGMRPVGMWPIGLRGETLAGAAVDHHARANDLPHPQRGIASARQTRRDQRRHRHRGHRSLNRKRRARTAHPRASDHRIAAGIDDDAARKPSPPPPLDERTDLAWQRSDDRRTLAHSGILGGGGAKSCATNQSIAARSAL